MIKSIISILSLLWVMLAGTPQPKYSLHKQPCKTDFRAKIDLWISRNFNYIALAAIIFLIIFFVLFCFWVCGVSATDSGTVYNHFQEVI